jgi:hypothetical protein
MHVHAPQETCLEEETMRQATSAARAAGRLEAEEEGERGGGGSGGGYAYYYEGCDGYYEEEGVEDGGYGYEEGGHFDCGGAIKMDMGRSPRRAGAGGDDDDGYECKSGKASKTCSNSSRRSSNINSYGNRHSSLKKGAALASSCLPPIPPARRAVRLQAVYGLNEGPYSVPAYKMRPANSKGNKSASDGRDGRPVYWKEPPLRRKSKRRGRKGGRRRVPLPLPRL